MTQTDSATTTNSLVPEQVAWNNGAFVDDCASGVQWSAGQKPDTGIQPHTATSRTCIEPLEHTPLATNATANATQHHATRYTDFSTDS
jgi:hypothetical protein